MNSEVQIVIHFSLDHPRFIYPRLQNICQSEALLQSQAVVNVISEPETIISKILSWRTSMRFQVRGEQTCWFQVRGEQTCLIEESLAKKQTHQRAEKSVCSANKNPVKNESFT